MNSGADDKPDFFYRLSCRTVALWAMIYHRLEVRGLENIPRSGGCVIAANHGSFLDPPLVACRGYLRRKIHFLARESLFDSKLGNWYLRKVGVMPMSRDRGDVGALRTAVKLLKSGSCVCLFPEGTRTRDGKLQTAKGGIGFLVNKAGVPVVPAYLDGTFRAYPRHARWIRPVKIRLTFGTPISHEEIQATAGDGGNYEQVAALIMQRIADAGGVSPT